METVPLALTANPNSFSEYHSVIAGTPKMLLGRGHWAILLKSLNKYIIPGVILSVWQLLLERTDNYMGRGDLCLIDAFLHKIYK